MLWMVRWPRSHLVTEFDTSSKAPQNSNEDCSTKKKGIATMSYCQEHLNRILDLQR
jgi:hypothetical protein